MAEKSASKIYQSLDTDLKLKFCIFLWQELIYFDEKHPCDIKNDKDIEWCCQLGVSQTIKADLGRMMNIQKLSSSHAGYEMSPAHQMMKFNITDILAGFPVEPVGQEPRYVWDDESIIPSCLFGKVNVNFVAKADTTCDLFTPVPTSAGICYAFNAERRLSPKKAKKYEEAFSFAFEAELEGPKTLTSVTYEAEKGKSFVFVYSRNSKSYGANMLHGDVLLSISDKYSFFNVRSEALKIQTGYKSTITVRPIVKKSYGIEHLPLSKRKCRFHHEVIEDDYSIFDFYSMETCIQECRVAFSIEKCRCIPWEMPFNDRYKWPEYQVCFALGTDCFNTVIQNASIEDLPFCRSRCISNCNNINFEMTHQALETLDTTECYNTMSTSLPHKALRKKYRQIRYLLSLYKLEIEFDSESDDTDFAVWCREAYQSDLAVVEVKMDLRSLIQYRQSERVDIVGKISNLGGILGLFTGMSFLSMAEIAFWTLKACMKSWSLRKRQDPLTGHSQA